MDENNAEWIEPLVKVTEGKLLNNKIQDSARRLLYHIIKQKQKELDEQRREDEI